jgi:hypothetical protein
VEKAFRYDELRENKEGIYQAVMRFLSIPNTRLKTI